MTAIGGIDIGNSTTEIVIARLHAGVPVPEAYRVIATKGTKGSDASIASAAAAVIEAEQELGVRCRKFAVAPLQPVDTFLSAGSGDADAQRAAVVVDLASDSPTPAGRGHVVGTFVWLADLGQSAERDSLVVGIAAGCDFVDAAGAIQRAIDAGVGIAGVLCESDDATLIANRLSREMPIVDEVDLSTIVDGQLLALEVAGNQAPHLADPFALSAIFGISGEQLLDLSRVTRQLAGRSSLALTRNRRPAGRSSSQGPGGGDEPLSPVIVGGREVFDSYAVPLYAVDDGAWVRSGVLRVDQTPTAAMRAQAPRDPSDKLAELLDRPVIARCSEPRAAAAGARTTPGCPHDAALCDLGGGTIDLVAGDQMLVGAGAGELLTAATATAMRWPKSLAEAALRHPSFRVQSPHVAHDEHGCRRWLDRPAPANAAGQLCIETDTGISALGHHLAPEQWYGIRKALKRTVIAANIERIARDLRTWPKALVVAGGVAEDSEVVAMIAERLRPGGTIVGKANVAGRLGPRAAVAWGQALLAVRTEAPIAA